MSPLPNADRFNGRIDDYLSGRPGYPKAILQTLREQLGALSEFTVLDVGSGTGLMTERLRNEGNNVIAIEPNAEMREAFARRLGFEALDAQAENTTLEDKSVNLIVAAQAFHWFDPVATAKEFKRILSSPGWVSLVWNVRNTQESEMDAEYDRILQKYELNSQKTLYRNATEPVMSFLGAYEVHSHPNPHVLSWDALVARLRSTSYFPRVAEPGYPEIIEEFHQYFNRFSIDGKLTVNYTTNLYLSRWA